MMAGKPIVAVRDAIPNIIRNGENGLLVEVDDDIGASKAEARNFRRRWIEKKKIVQHKVWKMCIIGSMPEEFPEEHSKLFNKEMD